jgi:hypothetical protein
MSEVEQSHIKPADIKQRLALLGSVNTSQVDRASTLKKLDEIVTDVPDDEETPQLYLRVAHFYENLGAADRAQDCYKKAILSCASRLGQEDAWLRPYFLKLANCPERDPRRTRTLDMFINNICRIRDPRIPTQPIESTLAGELNAQGCQSDAMRLLEDRFVMFGAGKAQRGRVENLTRQYVSMQEQHNNVVTKPNSEPNPAYVAKAYCFFFQGALKSNWTPEKSGSGTTKFTFAVERDGLTNVKMVQSSTNEGSDKVARAAFDRLKDIAASLPGFGGLRLTASFDHKRQQVLVSD